MDAAKFRLTAIAGGIALAVALGPPRSAAAADQAAFDAIETAIDSAIGAFTAAAGDLGSKADAFVSAFNNAKGDVEKAADANTQSDKKHASSALRRALRKVIGVGFKLRNLHARKTIPSDTRLALLDEVKPIEKALRALRKEL